ncbi:MAG TPA: hypothetical protein VFO93_00580 [Hymenobacter sp.]|uniref:hypothetical protein n=1 Tax=Hymenobacter sp. TaxID=1898978 RepID=UPI002D7E75FF|nr:hypothetical protein [Hymenobacter sp.]HET9502003.1 hypothetical protein [Hymenobacter sp.]
MEPTSHQPGLSSPAENTSHTSSDFSTTAAHATGNSPYPTDSPASTQPAAADGLKGKLDSAVATSKDKLSSAVADGKDKLNTVVASGKEKLDNAVASGKQWLNDSGVAEQAQQIPQKAKDLGNQALNKVNDLTTTQKAVIVGAVAAGVAFLIVRGGKKKREAGEYRERPRKSPFDHQPHTRDGDHAYDRRGQRPWGASRYGTASSPSGKSRVSSGSGYTSAPNAHSNDHGRTTSSDRSTSVGGGSFSPGQRRDQGPAGSRYDANSGGNQNPN